MNRAAEPPAEGRTESRLLAALGARLPGFMEGWAPSPGSPAAAVHAIFARWTAAVERALGEALPRAQLAFLDFCGETLRPAQAAQVPLVFTLSPQSPGDAPLPSGAAVAVRAGAGGGDPLLFSVAQPIALARARLAAVYSLDPASDRWDDHTAAATSGFVAFQGGAVLEHAIYLGHDTLFRLPAADPAEADGDGPRLTVSFDWVEAGGAVREDLRLRWEYLAADGFRPLSGRVADLLIADGVVDLLKEGGPPAAPRPLLGITSCWIRGAHLAAPAGRLHRHGVPAAGAERARQPRLPAAGTRPGRGLPEPDAPRHQRALPALRPAAGAGHHLPARLRRRLWPPRGAGGDAVRLRELGDRCDRQPRPRRGPGGMGVVRRERLACPGGRGHHRRLRAAGGRRQRPGRHRHLPGPGGLEGGHGGARLPPVRAGAPRRRERVRGRRSLLGDELHARCLQAAPGAVGDVLLHLAQRPDRHRPLPDLERRGDGGPHQRRPLHPDQLRAVPAGPRLRPGALPGVRRAAACRPGEPARGRTARSRPGPRRPRLAVRVGVCVAPGLVRAPGARRDARPADQRARAVRGPLRPRRDARAGRAALPDSAPGSRPAPRWCRCR